MFTTSKLQNNKEKMFRSVYKVFLFHLCSQKKSYHGEPDYLSLFHLMHIVSWLKTADVKSPYVQHFVQHAEINYLVRSGDRINSCVYHYKHAECQCAQRTSKLTIFTI